MKLVDVYEDLPAATTVLYMLLDERTPEQSISHRAMPTFEEHEMYVGSVPHPFWYLVRHEDRRPLGAVYLSDMREIGVAIFKCYHGNGYGSAAVMALMQLHPGKFLANMNPANEASEHLFKALGFKLIQHTYALEAT